MPDPGEVAISQPVAAELELQLQPGNVQVSVAAIQVQVGGNAVRWLVVPIETPTYGSGRRLDLGELKWTGATQAAATADLLERIADQVVETYADLTMDGGTDGADLLGPLLPPP